MNVTELRGDGAIAQEYRWALPSVLLGDGRAGGRVRRSTRDWIVDILMFLFACGLTFLSLVDLEAQRQPEALLFVEQVAGALACAGVWLRRRWPVGFAVVTSLLSSYLDLVGGASVVALFTVAVHRPFKISGPITLLGLVTLAPYVALRPQTDEDRTWALALGLAFVLTVFAWGIVVRARRQLVWSLRQRADSAAEEAKRLERERIAREMHDVLAHRISMLSLHAGALEFRPDAPPGEIAKAAGAIRTNAHLALQDLREVIGVLRHSASDGGGGGPGGETGEGAVPDRPQPTLADLPALVEECRHAGLDVRLDLRADSAPEGLGLRADGAPEGLGLRADGAPEGLDLRAHRVPEGLGRNLYRIVQEALTNARKHAPGAPVTVTVEGAPGKGLSAQVRNPLMARHGAVRHGARLPGAGAGLIGLTERAELAGGRLEHGATPEGEFAVRAWLPWPAETERESSG